MGRDVMGLEEFDRTHLELAGGKGANLGELTRIDGVHVPAGYCVTTDAFRRVMAGVTSIGVRLDRLSRLSPDDHDAIRALSAEVRGVIEATTLPDDLAAAITHSLVRLGEGAAYAVRSSATGEDLPTASFAGQQDTYLNVMGQASIVQHVRRCWASLFTERAVAYRLHHGIDHRQVHMAVVVQQMVVPRAAGVLFTADPVTANRKVAAVEAVMGLGEALVSGRVNADTYTVHDDRIVARTVATKPVAIVPSPSGGTEEHAIAPARRDEPALTDAEVVRLVQLGRRIEAHFDRPQDIEWCLVDDDFLVVQTRPITTLFPVPDASDGETHVYISVGHQQMMTDAMKPLGLSVWQLTTARPMAEAGGRLFVDVTRALAAATSRAELLNLVGRSDPLLGDALRTIVERSDVVPPAPDEGPARAPASGALAPIETDPAIVTELMERGQDSIATTEREIGARSGPALLDFILDDLAGLRRILFDPQSHQAIMAGVEATWWLNEHVQEWLGESHAADTLALSAPHNVTSQMGLALLDVADVIRPHPQVVAFLRHVDGEGFLDELPALPGGREARDAIRAYLEQYGMRCVGEIDITRPRWSERPMALVPMLLSHIENLEPGAAQRRFEQGRQDARRKQQELLERLQALPDGEEKADQTRVMIDRLRTFIGYREYPKYVMVSRYFLYRQALLEEAERLEDAGVLLAKEDVHYLRFEELRDVVRTHEVDDQLIRQREAAFRSYQALTPPRVITSAGEVFAGAYRRDDVPPGALVGVPVSAGTVDGRARVILDMAQADLGPGDILVTTSTDPSWTPAFLAIDGLVTEVGGLMSHGSVVAREYGLPAVVGVEHATRLVRDGQRIRVHGTDGYVELLPEPDRSGG